MPSPLSLLSSNIVSIVGLDLAWGDRNGDGLCLLRTTRDQAEVVRLDHTHGDNALLTWLKTHVPDDQPALVLVDAPLVIKNQTGSRAVDRLTHQLFSRAHAGCYPANLNKCRRPARVGQLLIEKGFVLGHDLGCTTRLAAEVYPHPAMVRLFRLDRIIKYKKGAVTQKRVEFARLQQLILKCQTEQFPQLTFSDAAKNILSRPWSKRIEDQTDALFCALIGYHHWLHRGERSDPIGDVETGFILLPAVLRD